MEVSGDHTRAVIAWAWWREDQLDGVAVEATFEPLVYRYALDVPPPPDPSEGAAPMAGPPSAPGVVLLFGVPLLIEPDHGAEPTVTVRPEAVLDFAAGSPIPATELATVTDGRLAAFTAEHLLLLVASEDGGIGRLATAPSWEPGSAWCRLDGALTGLTLYRSLGTGCGGWEPLAPAGTRTEFQGIPMSAP